MAQADVLIVGAGASGTLLAVNLLRRGAHVVLVERDPTLFARGVAYGEAQPLHLLNVRASGMSAFPDRPDHFTRWLSDRGDGEADSFATRQRYGDYLADVLGEAAAGSSGMLERMQAEVIDLVEDADGVTAVLKDGRKTRARHAVIASGNLAPLGPSGLDAGLPDDVWIADPWRSDPGDGLGMDDLVVLVGTGLTAVDIVLQLDASGFKGRILALSRRGLQPRAHAAPAPRPAAPQELPATASGLLRAVRLHSETHGWRGAVDSLRPVTQAIWTTSSNETRRRFLRHLRPWWDVHRHRIAPSIAERIDTMVVKGRLRIIAARPIASQAEKGGVKLTLRHRSSEITETLHARRIVNCTGPQTDVARSTDPLFRSLLDRGTIRRAPLGLGLDVDEGLQVVGEDGRSSVSIHAVGPVTRERFWEVVAVPDIREQAATLAATLMPQ